MDEADAWAALARSEARWEALSRHARELVAIVDETGRASFVNAGFRSLLGYDPDALTGTVIRDICHPDDIRRPGGLDDLVAHPGEGRGFSREYRLRHADGDWRVFDVSVTDLRHEPAVDGFVIHAREVTEREEVLERRAAEHAALAELSARALAGAAVDDLLDEACEVLAGCLAVPHAHALLADAAGTHLELRAAYGPFQDQVGRVRRSLADAWWTQQSHAAGRAVAIEDVRSMPEPIPPPLQDAGVRSGVVCALQGRDGLVGVIGVYTEASRDWPDADVDFLQAVGNVLGAAIERHQVGEELQRRALHDALTDLPNRILLVDRLEQALTRAARRAESVGLLFVDLDRFKRINDTLGHAAGDEVLVNVAGRLSAASRAGDTVARVGGDEFLVLCEDVTADGLDELGHALADAVAAPMCVEGSEVVLTASIGAAIATGDVPVDAESLVRDADLAMYRAKQLGRARVERFHVSMRDAARSRLELEEVVRVAAADRTVDVAYQPQVRLDDGSVVGLEALVRPMHPRLGRLPVEKFVAVADEVGLLDTITDVVLDEACATAARVRESIPDLRVAVNVTARQLTTGDLTARVAAVLDRHGLPPDALVTEVTETEILDDRAAAAALAGLRRFGVRVSIDDFGTGYSSLARLTRVQADELKIDRTFVAGVGRDRVADAVIRVALTLADALGLAVVAEGVERPDQCEHLAALGCAFGQGWLWSGPLDAGALAGWLEARRG